MTTAWSEATSDQLERDGEGSAGFARGGGDASPYEAGDTLLIDVDLGFHVSIQQRIRLRGVNTAELVPDKTSGQAAFAFVKKQLKGLNFLVIKTYKTDVYGRYVADVFYHPTIKNKELVFEKGLFLNQLLLDKELAIPV